MATCDPRRLLISSSVRCSSSRPEPLPLANTSSPAIRACEGSRRIRAREVTDFPEPDSPTRPRTSRGAMVRLRSRTATKDDAAGPRPGNSTVRRRTSRSGGTRHILAGRICLRALGSPSGDGSLWRYRLPSIIVWVFGRCRVVHKIICVVWCRNLLKNIVPVKVETIRKIIGQSVGISERRQVINLFNELQNAAEVVSDVRYISLPGKGRHHDQRHPKTVLVRVDNIRGDVVIPASPIVPSDDDNGVVPVLALADGINNRRNPGRSQTCIARDGPIPARLESPR